MMKRSYSMSELAYAVEAVQTYTGHRGSHVQMCMFADDGGVQYAKP